MNVNLRLEYKDTNNDHGHISEKDRKNRYLIWLEDELTKEREKVKAFEILDTNNT